jgi:UDP-N-acetylglucosamine--N-acetylmuramyl-(pentapeptide) pyrophosphoryl-undecaprenol N-acetylglucosamine transferase
MKQATKTIFITGGGTGGHIYPAVAIYKELQERGARLFYVGNPHKMEFEICKNFNFNFFPVNIDAMPRTINFDAFLWPFQLILAIIKAVLYCIKYRPEAGFATGGYVSAPALFAARILRIPYVLHDCDAYPGIVTRYFAPHAKKISIAFESAKKYLKNENVFLNGNPIRKDFLFFDKEKTKKEMGLAQGKFILLVVGGSLGAKSLNNLSLRLVERFKDSEDIYLIIQTGKKHYDEFIEKTGKLLENVLVAPYFEDMSKPLISADLVISRAGSLSISEICASNLASILVPFPYSANNHQELNAQKMEEIGASICVKDKNYADIAPIIDNLIHDKEKITQMKTAAKNNAKPMATIIIAEQILESAR